MGPSPSCPRPILRSSGVNCTPVRSSVGRLTYRAVTGGTILAHGIEGTHRALGCETHAANTLERHARRPLASGVRRAVAVRVRVGIGGGQGGSLRGRVGRGCQSVSRHLRERELREAGHGSCRPSGCRPRYPPGPCADGINRGSEGAHGATRLHRAAATVATRITMASKGLTECWRGAEAAKPSTWNLMGVARGPREARGPKGERLEGRGTGPQDALLELTVRLKAVKS